MRQFEKSTEQRREKIAEKQNLEQRKQIKDKRYHVIDDDDDESEFLYYPIKGMKNYGKTR